MRRRAIDPIDEDSDALILARLRPRYGAALVRLLSRKVVLAFAVVGTALFALCAFSAEWWREGVSIASAHEAHEVAHPGWSFPARVFSRALPANAPIEHLVAHARALGYPEDCSKSGPRPGAYCAKTMKVAPKHGAELEPVLLGWLIGPDGEIREHLSIEEAPKHLLDAIVIAEDRDFWDHRGVNLAAIARASFANVKEGSYAQGASTLTMQLVRNLNQRKERTLLRKWREAVMALATDRHLGKRGVLGMYLDAPYLGQFGNLSVCGFRAAARRYFGKDATDLSLAEAATLAAILPAPGRFAPDRHPDLARERRDRVLKAMQEILHYDVADALAEPIRTVDPGEGVLRERFPSYLSAARAELERRIDPTTLYGGGLSVTTGISIYMQQETEELFRAKTKYFETVVPRKRDSGPLEAAGVLLDVDSGTIRAVYGGADVHSTDFNRATQARRQGGSAFKPVVYALAMSQTEGGRPRFTASTVEPNAPRTFKTPRGDWRPRNVMNDYTETACLAYALAWSQNIATASLLEAAGGPQKLIDFASKAGFETGHFPPEMGLALGQGEVTVLEMAEFSATVARGGQSIKGTTLLGAVDVRGKARLPRLAEGRRVLEKESAALVRELMRLVIDYGTGGAARGLIDLGYVGQAMGKTGTTDSEKDLWFVGATPRYAAALWLGYDHPASIGASASDLAAPLWGWWMGRVTKPDGKPPQFAEQPKLVQRSICTVSGQLAGPGCKAIPAPFLPGTEPKSTCTIDHMSEGQVAGASMTSDAGIGAGAEHARESLLKRIERESHEEAAAAHAD
jgi:membrane peptidoglycan carboxypeptidase